MSNEWTATSWQRNRDIAAGIDALRRVKIDMVQGFHGTKYAIRDGPLCMNKSGEWEHEPIPSSRDDAFMDRCRFDSRYDAVCTIERYEP